MSGEAGGGLVVGALVLGLAPYIITAAAVAGLAVGAVAVSVKLGSMALNYAQEKKEEKTIEIQSCSSNLAKTYSDISKTVEKETEEFARCSAELSKKIKSYESKTENIQGTDIPLEEMENRIQAFQNDMREEMRKSIQSIREDIIKKYTGQLDNCIKTIDESTEELRDSLNWKSKEESALALQKSEAEAQLQDALATINSNKKMMENTKDSYFIESCKSVEQSYERAKSFLEKGLYESAFALSRTVIREGAMLAVGHVQKERELEMESIYLRAFLEGLLEDIKKQQFISVEEDGVTKIYDLQKFSQGVYLKTVEKIEECIENAKIYASDFNSIEMEKLIDYCSNELEPEMRHVIQKSKSACLGYMERVVVLNKVAEYMEEQGYNLSWVMPKGGDCSQEIVVHFEQPITGDSISVCVSNDNIVEDIASLSMQVFSFNKDNPETLEVEREQMRSDLMEALKNAGIDGALTCSGYQNQSSPQIEMKQKDTVRNMEVEAVI